MFRLKEIGTLAPIDSIHVKESKIGLGFEKLDRDVFDPEKAYPHVAKLGVKWIRIQSGWARTEKKKGVYDFAWLDSVVDNLLAIGTMPWICLCYGNGLYNEDAAKVFGAVGCPPIKSDEEKQAWHRYVATLVARYRDRGVDRFEVWNEPDSTGCWKHGASGKEYGQFVIDTTRAIRESAPDAKVIAGAMAVMTLPWLTELCSTGCLSDVWGFTYHDHSFDESNNAEKVRFYNALLKRYNPSIKIIQGESGSQSRPDGAGAHCGLAWTQEKQAKQLLRHTVSDLLCDVEFMSFFSCMDMIEALHGKVSDKASYLDYGYFGVLSAGFDENGRATGEYTPKISYRALQSIAALFNGIPEVINFPYFFTPRNSILIGRKQEPDFNAVTAGAFKLPDGTEAFVYWQPTDLITSTVTGTVSISFATQKDKPRLLDPMTGKIYEIPDSLFVRHTVGCLELINIPLKDYPLFLLF